MSGRALETLVGFLKLQPDLLPKGGRVLVLRAESRPELEIFSGSEVICHQTLKGDYDRLAMHGYKVAAEVPCEVDLCVFIGTKQKEENLWNFGLGVRSLARGGVFLCALPNELGAGRFERELAICSSDVISYTKNRCRVFGVRKDDKLKEEVVAGWCARGDPRLIAGTELKSRPGIFGWSKVDVGSELLVEHLPTDLAGRGADLGAGYGYLSYKALSLSMKIQELHVVEAEGLAIEMAKVNLAQFAQRCRLEFHWLDVVAGLALRNLDWVVMNPPFHAGKVVRMSLGGKFVVQASKILRPGGQLYMVGNSHLPYESTLRDHFAQVELLVEAKGFNVFRACKES
ncbi:MAG: methyltransferase [Oligoflexia bacterium]|nr:methyltransferase [Oligoflexia bacterium]